MVAPLALPLVGLLAAGAGMALKPHYENYAAKTRGKYREGLLADVDHSDPDALGLSLFKGGLLDTKDFQADVRTAFEGVQNRQNAIQRQKIAAGPGHAAVALDREQWEHNKIVAEAERQAWQDFVNTYASDGDRDALSNPFTPPTVRDKVMEGVIKDKLKPPYDPDTDETLQRELRLLREEAALEGAQGPQLPDSVVTGLANDYFATADVGNLASTISSGVTEWTNNRNNVLTAEDSARRREVAGSIEQYIRTKYRLETGAELSDAGFRSYAKQFPLPQGFFEYARKGLTPFGGPAMSDEAVREFWRNEVAQMQQLLQLQAQRIEQARNGVIGSTGAQPSNGDGNSGKTPPGSGWMEDN